MKRIASIFYLLLSCYLVHAQVDLPLIWADHMVLQREMTVSLAGTATPKDKLRITFRGKEYATKTDKTGRFSVQLPTGRAGGPFQLNITGKRTPARTIQDILVGEVWLCSGQSNMEWPLRMANDYDAALSSAEDPLLRQFFVPKAYSSTPQEQLQAGSWAVATPETIGEFTAVGYFFARRLREELNVPVALLHSSWGGSRIEAWMDAQSLGYRNLEEAQTYLDNYEAEQLAAKRAALLKKLPSIPTKDEGLQNGRAVWAATDLEDSDWKTLPVPGLWEQAGWESLDGTVWLRRHVELTADQTGPATLSLARIDDGDVTYVNGVQVGTLPNAYAADRVYTVPAGVLRPGKNVITVHVIDTGGGGGIYGAAEQVYLEVGDHKFSLAGDWKMRVGEVYLEGKINFDVNQLPTMLYNRMIHPLRHYPIAGALWYQGESNAGSEEDATRYAEQFQTMIRQWRADWNIGDFPFYWVQLANFQAPATAPGAVSHWATLRQSQSAALALPRTGEAVIIDIGEADDIHPRNKLDVGERLARIALADTYTRPDVVYSGPRLERMERRGPQLQLTFTHTGSGLTAHNDRYGYLRGFAVAGPDGVYHWARAHIQDGRVIVQAPEVAQPTHLRYAWADNPDDANLYNAEGLPASPFQASVEE